jgi:hypothetical protein
MGMFDYYAPAGTLQCPIDNYPLVDWQGKEGPCALFLWREGVAAPSHERITEESRLSDTQLQEIRLPPIFTIYSYDCPVHSPLTATCTSVEGVWSTTKVHKLGVYTRDDDELRQALRAVAAAQGIKHTRSLKLQEFTLIDLSTQMRFLPQIVRTWPRERLLAWLREWGEVREVTGAGGRQLKDTYMFRSWVGQGTVFKVTDDGRLYLAVTSGWAWPDDME